jgi:16S rRNA (uracil1498-N3)-methyltransferase
VRGPAVTPPVFLVDELPAGAAAVLDGDEGWHAAAVLRLRAGAALWLSDGVGGLAECTVVAAERDRLRLAVDRRARLDPPAPRLVAVQALAKGDRGESAVEIMTELGVDEIVPWAAARSVVRWQGDRGDRSLAKWRSTARAAAKQSRRAWLPAIADQAGTAAVTARIHAAAAVVLHEEATTPLAAATLPTAGDLVVVVGPEGGITPDELAAFTQAGAVPVRLGQPVLRASTAGAAALAVLSVRTGRWT